MVSWNEFVVRTHKTVIQRRILGVQNAVCVVKSMSLGLLKRKKIVNEMKTNVHCAHTLLASKTCTKQLIEYFSSIGFTLFFHLYRAVFPQDVGPMHNKLTTSTKHQNNRNC